MIVITGPSGAGKGTLIRALMPRVPELERRLRERATESAGEIGERLDLAESQLRQASLFDHVVENDDLERAVADLVGVATAARANG